MNHPLSPGGITHALLDANVLLPPRLSDVLFDLCLEGLFSARWNATKALSVDMKFLAMREPRYWQEFQQRCMSVTSMSPQPHWSCSITRYKATPKIKSISVSSNLRDLAVTEMKRLGIVVATPGNFIDSLAQADGVRVGLALDRCVNSLKNPPYTRARILEALLFHGAKATARHFARAWA